MKINEDLTRIQDSINLLEKEKQSIISDIIEKSQKTVKEWSLILDEKDFDESIFGLFRVIYLSAGGSDYFSLTPSEKKRTDYEKFKSKQLKDDKSKFFHCSTNNRFFWLMTNQRNCTVRSSDESRTYTINNNMIHYKYYYLNKNGFGSDAGKGDQTFKIDLKTMKVVNYNSSDIRYAENMYRI